MTSYGDEHDSRADGSGSSWSRPHPQRRAWPVAPSHTPPGLPTSAREPDAGTGALDAPTDTLAQLTAADLARQAPAPAPPDQATPDPTTPNPAAPDQAPAVGPAPGTAPPGTAAPITPPPVTAPPFPSGPTSPAPYLASAPPAPGGLVPASAPPAPGPVPASGPPLVPVTPARWGRAGWLALAAVTVVLLVGVFAIVKVAGPGSGGAPPAAAGGPAPLPTGTATAAASGTAGGGTAGEQAAAGTSGSPSAVPGGRGASPPAAGATRPAGRPATGPIGDDFTSGLNGSMWDVYGTSSSTTYNSTMVRVSGGELQILGVGNSPTASANKSGGLCWCGTNGNHVYGKWQVRARFDAGSGYRQVIELWPRSDSDSTDGSINFAGDSDAAKQNLVMSVLQPGGGRDWSGNLTGDFTAWHTYTVEWRAGSVKMWVDSRQVYDSATSGTPLTVPNKPMHLVLQQDKGPADGIPAANSSTPAQVVMHVDWVRYYS